MATAVPINVDLAILMIDPPRMFVVSRCPCRHPTPARPQGIARWRASARAVPVWDHLHANIVPLLIECHPRRYQSPVLVSYLMVSISCYQPCVVLATDWSYSGSMTLFSVPVREPP